LFVEKDFDDKLIRVNFIPGKTKMQFTIPVFSDGKFEETEYFNIKLVTTDSARKLKIKFGVPKTAFANIIDEESM